MYSDIVIAAHFLNGSVTIDTTACSLTSTDFPGTTIHGTWRYLRVCNTELNPLKNLRVCQIEFKYHVQFHKDIEVDIIGQNALSIASNYSITVEADMNVNGKNLTGDNYDTYLGGYHNFLQRPEGYGM